MRALTVSASAVASARALDPSGCGGLGLQGLLQLGLGRGQLLGDVGHRPVDGLLGLLLATLEVHLGELVGALRGGLRDRWP